MLFSRGSKCLQELINLIQLQNYQTFECGHWIVQNRIWDIRSKVSRRTKTQNLFGAL